MAWSAWRRYDIQEYRLQCYYYFLMIVRVESKASIRAILRAGAVNIAAVIGGWDVQRLVSAGNQSPTAFDLTTCPIIATMQFICSHVSISKNVLLCVLFLGNIALYGLFQRTRLG